MKLHRDPGRGSIFIKLLTGYLALTLVIILLTGVVSYALLRAYLIDSNKRDLLRKAEALTPHGAAARRLRPRAGVPPRGRNSDADRRQVIYVDSDMKARQAPSWTRPNRSSGAEPQDFEMLDVIDALDQSCSGRFLTATPPVTCASWTS